MNIAMTMRERLACLGPYTSLVLILIPLLIVEPLKVIAVLIAGEGHWLTGTMVGLGAYAASLLVVERLFRALKPNMMRAEPLRRAWLWLVAARHKGWVAIRGLLMP
jgi:hypothetical protein